MANGLRYFGICAALVGVTLAGCTQFPELDEGRVDLPGGGDYPRLMPLDTLLAEAPRNANEAVATQIEGRVAGLTTRADRLRTRQAGGDRDLAKRIARLRQKASALQDL